MHAYIYVGMYTSIHMYFFLPFQTSPVMASRTRGARGPSGRHHHRPRFSQLALGADQSMHRRYPLRYLVEFKVWLLQNTDCLPNSQYPAQIVNMVARYLYQSGTGAEFTARTWDLVHDATKVDAWLSLHSSNGASAATLYNYVSFMDRASDFMYASLGRPAPRGYNKYITRKRRLYRRRRRSESQRHLHEDELAFRDCLTPLSSKVLNNDNVSAKFDGTVVRAKQYLELAPGIAQDTTPFGIYDFLFAMRLALTHLVASNAARPSAIYTLKTEHVAVALGSWHSTIEPLTIHNADHKTGRSCGPARLVVSGNGRLIFRQYYETVRAAALKLLALDDMQFVFFNSSGKPLNASSLSANLARLQSYCAVEDPCTTTDIRKFVTSTLREQPPANPTDSTNNSWVAVGLNHSVATSNRHYRLTGRDRSALALHDAINDLLAE